jgi:hypothetical protein
LSYRRTQQQKGNPVSTSKTPPEGYFVNFRQGDAAGTILTGVITRVWEKPEGNPYVTIKTDEGTPRTFVRYASAVTLADLEAACDLIGAQDDE